jgi:hypothetical protein
MTCTDCHSPHDANTVAAFMGDRRRTATDSVVTTMATDRLLKKNPGGSVNTVTVYGSDWCGGCHKGRLMDAGGLHNHPVETQTIPGYQYYGSVWRLSTTSSPTSTPTSTAATERGPLGGNNNGYLVLTPRPWGVAVHYPICQQCHEDPRYAGDTSVDGLQGKPGTYTVNSADGTNTVDNPRVQVFPHESTSTAFLLESGDDLCTNCHPAGSLP